MKIEQIKGIIEEYFDSNKRTQYSILIDGKWGSGKTYFWNEELQKIAKEKGYETIYISLNGIEKAEEIEYSLFIKVIPFFKTKNKDVITLTKNIANVLSKFFTRSDISDLFRGISLEILDFSKYIICFDDIERCRLPIDAILGYINQYVEHKFMKSILIADEKHLYDKFGNDYGNIKEKVIGRVVKYDPDIKEILPNLIKKHKSDPELFNYLMNHIKSIISLFEEYGVTNLRVVLFYIESISRIFSVFKLFDVKYQDEVILFTMIITIEFKNGRLKSSDYNVSKGIEDSNELFLFVQTNRSLGGNGSEEKEETYSSYFYKTYLQDKISQYQFYKSIYVFILTGYLDTKLLKEELKSRIPKEVSEEVKAYRKIINYKFRELSNTEFETLTEQVLSYGENGKYSIYDYVSLLKFFNFFVKNDLIKYTKEDITEKLYHGLSIAKKETAINNKVIESFLHFKDEDSDVEKIKSRVAEIHDEIVRGQKIEKGNDIVIYLKNFDEYGLSDLFLKYQLNPDLLKYTNSELLTKTILKIPNKQLFNFSELLKQRYSSSNIGEFLIDEKTTLRGVYDQLKLYLDKYENEIKQPQRFLLSSLETDLLIICDTLESTKKVN